ncbi:BON domain-containing protein [Pseudomonas sp. S75]|uniref:BON domain-containing protein n=1 Tax=unclassified Pseudomonas TaxID=196821 RepID=UPI001906B51F|nr:MULTISPECIES: BON domain-containing protein [unclassified Pseudomonas]MBJ9978064.1 BON domain-containing protein [Pseudomonas sp. S30]MBK0155823.1 BON domain-containing protein [Pseudomonas sp. S75]
MKKFAIAAAAATALTMSMASAVFAAEATQAPVMLASNQPAADAKQETVDTWITTKVKADLLTEKGIPGSDIKVETTHGVVALSSKDGVTLTSTQKETAVAIAKKIKGVKSVTAEALKAQ